MTHVFHSPAAVSRFSHRSALRLAVGLSLGAPALWAQSPEAAEPSGSDAIIDLPTVEVVSSADASEAGLLPAYAGGQVASGGRAGILGALDFLSTPFNLTSYTEELIENQQAASIGEVLLNDPAVRVARGFGNFQQLYMVRGLPIYSDDMAYNGLYGLLPRQYLAAELVERVEVLRGANAFLNGAAPGGSGLGGAVNVLPKRAPNAPLTELTAGVQSGGQLYGAFDLGRRFDEDRLGVRLVGARRDGDSAVDGESVELSLLAVGLDYRREQLRLSADLGYQNLERDATQPSITIGAGLEIPAAPEAGTSVAQPWTFSDEEDVFGTLRGEYDLSDTVTLWGAFGMRRGDEANSFANPTVTAADGTSSAYRFDNVREDRVATGEVGVRAEFLTGDVMHHITASAAAFDLESKNAYAFSNFAGFAGNIYDPMPADAPAPDFFTGGSMDDPLLTERTETHSFAVADMVSLLDDQLILTAGLRHQTIETWSYDFNTGDELSRYSESAVTPVGGVLYKLSDRFSVYANYIEGLTRGDVAPASSGGTPVVNAGEALEPYATEQMEAGLKFDFGVLGGAVSVFQSEKPIAGVDADGVFGIVDDQRNRGLELTAYGEPVEGLRVLGGLSVLETEIEGRDSIGAPTTQLNLGAEWDAPFLDGLTFDGRVLYTSSQYADAANTQEVPSWNRLDLGVRYDVHLGGDRTLTLRGRVENVADEDYWASAGGFPGAGYLTVGAPRTLLLSGTVQF
ncbi:MAG: TonB-dependent receptor [Opitutales bacterium]